MEILLLINTLVFLFLGLIWSNSSFLNFFIKYTAIILAIANGVMLARLLGYLVKGSVG